MIRFNPLSYFYFSIFIAIIPIINHIINLNKYKVFNPSAEMKRDLFIKDNKDITNLNNYHCFPKDNNCYEIINNIKYNNDATRICTLEDWQIVNSDNCNIYNFFEKLIIIFSIFIIVARFFSSCKIHYFEINNLQDLKKINNLSILVNCSIFYEIIINIYTFSSGFNDVFFVSFILEIIIIPTLMFVFELNKNNKCFKKCCKIKKLRYTIRIVPINIPSVSQSTVDISNL
jgi:hypothetical protein